MARVLVVDDNDYVRSALVRALRSGGHDVDGAVNGAAALARLALDPLPDVIVLDLQMPVMDGIAFRAVQVGDHRLAQIPVVVASADPPAKADGLLEGTTVLRKPVSADAVADAITRALAVRVRGA